MVMEDDLFAVNGSVHEIIARKGRQGAREAARLVAREPGRNAPFDILTGRRGTRIIEAAATHMSGDISPEKVVRSHVYSGWCHAGMPHKRPRIEDANWRIETDYVTLLVEPGTRVDSDGRETPVGLPFGAYARPGQSHLEFFGLMAAIGGRFLAAVGRLEADKTLVRRQTRP